MKKNMKIYFSGRKLYGDDFSSSEIKKWFEDEKEGYSGLVNLEENIYEHHGINKMHGFDKLKKIKNFDKVLSFGGATGDELLPIIHKIREISIIDPSKKLKVSSLNGKPIRYVSPKPSGKLSFKDNSFDLITCFGVLHHVPNVSVVFNELIRILKPGGFILIREPIVSMGDWRMSRKGLTKRERGIPEKIFDKEILDLDLKIVSKRRVFFPLLRRMNFGKYKGGNSKSLAYIDSLLSKIFFWNNRYHARNFLHKLRGQSVFYVLKKSIRNSSI